VLRKGGNAIDAAVAVGYALAVVYPAAGNLGGGGFMTLQLADGRKTFLDFREKAPLAATPGMYLDAAGNVVPNASTRGHLAVAVPGSVAGLEAALAKYGTMKRAELIAPRSASPNRASCSTRATPTCSPRRRELRATRRARRSSSTRADPGPRASGWCSAILAATLRQIAEAGAAGFYKGPVAQALVASSRAGKGLITQGRPRPLRGARAGAGECDYRGYRIVSAPPPSSGGTVLCEMLNILEGYPLKDWGFRSAAGVHVQIEAMRHAYLDRNHALGDPDFVANPVAAPHRQGRMRRGSAPRSIHSARPLSVDLKAGSPPHEGSNTTHYSIVDGQGNAVAVTYTLNDWFGAKVTAAGTGVLLNNEMDDFTIKLGAPNTYGLVQGEPNAIAPGKTPLSSMTPTIVTRAASP
jgi:gamma-glutamyltranspeptidase/glutathione hydrolase